MRQRPQGADKIRLLGQFHSHSQFFKEITDVDLSPPQTGANPYWSWQFIAFHQAPNGPFAGSQQLSNIIDG
jgi:hypothetical protein